MTKRTIHQGNKWIFISLFFLLNIINGFISSSGVFNKVLSPYPRDTFMFFNSLIGDLGFFIILFGVSFIVFRKDRGRFIYLTVITCITSFIVVLMSMYLSNFGMFFSFYNLRAFGADGAANAFGFMVDAVVMLLRGAQILFLLPMIIILVIHGTFFSKKMWDKGIYKRSVIKGFNRIYVGILAMCFGGLLMLNSMGAFLFEIKETWYEDNATPLYGVQSVGFFNYYVYDAISFATNRMGQIDEAKREETRQKLETYQSECNMIGLDGETYCNAIAYQGVFSNKNLLLIQAESINNFLIGLEVNIDGTWVEVTPNINRLLSSSIYYTNFYTTVGIGNTSDAEFSAMTGLYPTGYQYTVFEFANERYPSLARAFNNIGFDTFSLHANTGVFYDRKIIHENMYEFQKHYSKEDLEQLGLDDPSRYIHYWMSDVDLLKATVQQMKIRSDQGVNSFAYPILVTSHMPYSDHPNLYQNHDPIFPTGFLSLDSFQLGYLKHAHYVDVAIGIMIDELIAAGLYDETIIMLYGDHGSGLDMDRMFLQHGEYFRNDIHGIYGVDYATTVAEQKLASRKHQQEIPFLIFDPTGTLEPGFQHQAASIVDIARTVRNLWDLPTTYYFGTDLLANVPRFVYNPKNGDIFINGAIISANSKEYYIYQENEFTTILNILRYDIVLRYQEYKDFNDKLLRYPIFQPLS